MLVQIIATATTPQLCQSFTAAAVTAGAHYQPKEKENTDRKSDKMRERERERKAKRVLAKCVCDIFL